MTLRRTVTTSTVTAALLLTGSATALADDSGIPDDGASTPTGEAITPIEQAPAPEPAPEPIAPVVEQEVPVVEQEAPTAPDETATPTTDDERTETVEAETEAADETAPDETDATPTDEVQAPTPVEEDAPAPAETRAAAPAATPTAADAPAYPSPDYEAHWHDGGQDGFPCDYWYFVDPQDDGSGRDWAGWSGTPQLHLLHHTIVDADGTVHMVYDRDIANSWYHAWGEGGDEHPEFVVADIDGMHWTNTAAQQTILVNGYRGGNDWDARLGDAMGLLERAGVTLTTPDFGYTERQEWMTDEDWAYYEADAIQYRARFADYTAYTATQFAVWYFSTGNDVMSMFFDVDDAGHVTLSAKAEGLLNEIPDDYDWENYDGEAGSWSHGYTSDRRAVLETAAWLIEQAITEVVVMPQPGFVPQGSTTNADGSTDYGFTATLTAGTGNVTVELRTTDGSPLPAGVVLVDAHGNPVTSVAPGQQVFVRVPAGMDIASLPQFQLWGAAQGTEKGSPNYYVGEAHSSNEYDEETGMSRWIQRWMIGLGNLDKPTTIWDWIALDLSSFLPTNPVEPAGPVLPVDPTEPTDPIVAPSPEAPAPAPMIDPVNLADPTQTVAVAASAQHLDATPTQARADSGTGRNHLARTGSELAGIAGLAGLIVLAGTGLVITGRRRVRTADED